MKLAYSEGKGNLRNINSLNVIVLEGRKLEVLRQHTWQLKQETLFEVIDFLPVKLIPTYKRNTKLKSLLHT